MNKKLLLNSRLFFKQKIAKIDKEIAKLNREIADIQRQIKEQKEQENWWKK